MKDQQMKKKTTTEWYIWISSACLIMGELRQTDMLFELVVINEKKYLLLCYNEYSLIFVFKKLLVDGAQSWEEIRLFIEENFKLSFQECHCSETDDVMLNSVIFLSLSIETNTRVNCLYCWESDRNISVLALNQTTSAIVKLYEHIISTAHL